MQPILVHYCTICTYNTPVPFTASVFSQNQTCSHCGAISTGITTRVKKEEEEEEANMQQEELARLFSANMNLAQAPPQQAPQPEPQVFQEEPMQQQQVAEEQVPKPIIYASQHYTHSYHVVPARQVPQEEPVQPRIIASELEAMLVRNSIDPSLLFPSQIDLFRNADDDQRLRLLELWRISPPQGRQGYPDGTDYNMSRQLYDWPPTSLAQEEAMAKLRYEKMLEEQAQAAEIQTYQQQLDFSMDENTARESAAVQDTRDLLTSSPQTQSAEPYILSGYDMLAKREYEESAQAADNHLKESTKYNQATDPVYNYGTSNGGLWEKNVGSILDMENQYGAFAHAREYEVQSAYADQEMVM